MYETERLLLCVFNDAHIDAVKEFWGDADVMALCNGATPHEVLPKIISGYRKCHEVNGLSVYAVKNKTSDKIIGAAGFNITSNSESAELIYHFCKDSWGMGFASEAAAACLELARNYGKVQCITASADPLNKSSMRILEKIGFSKKGTKWFEDTQQEEAYYEFMF